VALQELLPGVKTLSQGLVTMVELPQLCSGKARQDCSEQSMSWRAR